MVGGGAAAVRHEFADGWHHGRHVAGHPIEQHEVARWQVVQLRRQLGGVERHQPLRRLPQDGRLALKLIDQFGGLAGVPSHLEAQLENFGAKGDVLAAGLQPFEQRREFRVLAERHERPHEGGGPPIHRQVTGRLGPRRILRRNEGGSGSVAIALAEPQPDRVERIDLRRALHFHQGKRLVSTPPSFQQLGDEQPLRRRKRLRFRQHGIKQLLAFGGGRGQHHQCERIGFAVELPGQKIRIHPWRVSHPSLAEFGGLDAKRGEHGFFRLAVAGQHRGG